MGDGLLIGNAPGFRNDDTVKAVTERNSRAQGKKENQFMQVICAALRTG